MDRKLNLEAYELQEHWQNNQISFDENDSITLEKRQLVKEKLINNFQINENVDDLITSLECYCFIILQSLK